VADRIAPQFLIDHDHGIVAACGPGRSGSLEVTLIDLADGDELWTYDEPGGSFVGLAGGRAYITADTSASSACQFDEDVASGHDLLAFDARTGDEIWSIGGEDQEVVVSYGREVFSEALTGPLHWIALVDETRSQPVSSFIDPADGSTIASSTWDRDDEYRAVIGFDGVPVGLLQGDDGVAVFDPSDDVRRFDFGTDAQLVGYAHGTIYIYDDERLTAIG
jgi:outer membrane protein assembly factor BamB